MVFYVWVGKVAVVSFIPTLSQHTFHKHFLSFPLYLEIVYYKLVKNWLKIVNDR